VADRGTSPAAKTFASRHGLPALGAGVGLRFEHVERVLQEGPPVPWFEVVSENYMDRGGLVRRHIRAAAERWPIVCHGVSLNVGSTDPLDRDYLARLKRFADHVNSPWVSDHLCFTGVGGVAMNDLLPLPRTDEAAEHVARRVREVQDFLGRPFLVENVSSYVDPTPDGLDEPTFARAVCERADCGMLLDVNNVHVNAVNFDRDPWDQISRYPLERVVQLHLAGPEKRGRLLLDTHGAPIQREVWDLTRRILPAIGPTSVLVEWDNNVPPLERLLEERETAQALYDSALSAAA
jgi:hypothetical protein